MPISASDIQFYLSGGSGNSDPNASLGGAVSTTQISTTALHNLFDAVGSGEASSGDTEYRALFVKNNHGSIILESAVIWIQSQTTSPDTSLEIALADEGIASTIETVADESTAPSGPTFSAPSSKGSGLSIGNLGAGQYHGIWIKRIVSAAAAAVSNDTAILRVEGNTT